jgi:cell division septal protein FtsQ
MAERVKPKITRNGKSAVVKRKTSSAKPKTSPRKAIGRSAARKTNSRELSLRDYAPLIFMVVLAVSVGLLLFLGYQVVTAKIFATVRDIDIAGNSRNSKSDIEKIARTMTAKTGLWNADLKALSTEIEKLPNIKTAVVSRVLPDGLRIRVFERIPKAVVKKVNSELMWVDEDAEYVGLLQSNEARPPFVLQGWDERGTDAALKANKERVNVYVNILAELKEQKLAERVKSLNLEDTQEVQATVEDAGANVFVRLGHEDYGKRLQVALETLSKRRENGNTTPVEYVISQGKNVIVKEAVQQAMN